MGRAFHKQHEKDERGGEPVLIGEHREDSFNDKVDGDIFRRSETENQRRNDRRRRRNY